MEKIIHHNNEAKFMQYIVITLFSLLTFRKVKRVEELRKELKELQQDDFDKV